MTEIGEKGCFVIASEKPEELLYAIVRRPSPAQWRLCSSAVELHNRISDIPIRKGEPFIPAIDENRKLDLLRSIGRAFSAGGVQGESYPCNSLRQLDDMQARVFSEFFTPSLNRARIWFALSFVALAIVGEACAFAMQFFSHQPKSVNYVHLMVAAAFGAMIFAVGRGFHHDFAAFDEDMQALSSPLLSMSVASGVALFLAILLSTGFIKIEIGDFKPSLVETDLSSALALGAVVGFAKADAFKLVMRFAGQAVSAFHVATDRHIS